MATADRARWTVDRMRTAFRDFAATQCAGRSAVYEALSEHAAHDDDLLELLLSAEDEQRRPSLLFAAVCFLLGDQPGAELSAYYPIYGGDRPVDAQLTPAFEEFWHRNRQALREILATRATQTNDIRRCVALRLGMRHVASQWPSAVALVEVGASAGLNLLVDRYAYAMDGAPTGDPGATAVISCEVRGPGTPAALGDPPVITRRLGIDQRPVDPTAPAAQRWLESFIWPEQIDELRTLRTAIRMRLATPGVQVVHGDAVRDTARLLGELPAEEPIVVFTASLLSYLSPPDRQAFVAQLERAAQGRRVAWVFAEAPALAASAGITAPALHGPLSKAGSVYAVGVRLSHRGQADDSVLAVADPYLRWLAPGHGDDDDFQWAQQRGLW